MLQSLFGARTFLDTDVEAWQLETWALLLAHFGGEIPFRDIPLVSPTPNFFPPTEAEGHARALNVFDCTRRAMNIETWPCRLEVQTPRRGGERVSEFVTLGDVSAPNGTFRSDPDGSIVITYAPELLAAPVEMIATFAHELSHYLLAAMPDAALDETHELMTDLMVAYSGFGIFGANACFSFQQHADAFGQGWSSRHNGYLSPRSWAFALAVFTALRETDDGMERWLVPEIASLWRQASKYLGRHPHLLVPLRDIMGQALKPSPRSCR